MEKLQILKQIASLDKIMLFTISDYQKQKGVSLQFITEYTKKGAFKKNDLPLFVEFQGEKIQVGKKNVASTPSVFAR